MRILSELKLSRPEQWKEGFTWLLWSVIGGLLPTWIALATKIFMSFKSSPSITDHGEFAIYTASYGAASFYILFKDFASENRKDFPSKSALGLVLLICIVLSLVVYMPVFLADNLSPTGSNSPPIPIDKKQIATLSYIMLPVTLIVSFIIVVTEQVRLNVDLEKKNENNLSQLNRDFEGLE